MQRFNLGLIILPWQRVVPYSLPVRVAALIAYFSFAVLIAHVVYRFVEEPARRRLRGWFDKRESHDDPVRVGRSG